MKRVVIAALALMCTATVWAAEPPADRVLVMYFHRTQRCPTCLKMGSYSEEAVRAGFAKQIQEGLVEFHYVDFQDQKNAALAQGYKISGPALIVARVKGTNVNAYQELQDIWTKVREKPEFLQYVREHVEVCLKSS